MVIQLYLLSTNKQPALCLDDCYAAVSTGRGELLSNETTVDKLVEINTK